MQWCLTVCSLSTHGCLVAGCWLLVAGCWSLVTGHWLLYLYLDQSDCCTSRDGCTGVGLVLLSSGSDGAHLGVGLLLSAPGSPTTLRLTPDQTPDHCPTPMPVDLSPESSVQSPESSVQSPVSRGHSPEAAVQRLQSRESRVQSTALSRSALPCLPVTWSVVHAARPEGLGPFKKLPIRAVGGGCSGSSLLVY
jgi:hypothetical protein